MADQIPLKRIESGGSTTALGEMESGETVGVAHGGTGKSSVANGKILYTSAANTFSEATITAAGRALIDDADAAAQRTTLDLLSKAELTNTIGNLTNPQTDLLAGRFVGSLTVDRDTPDDVVTYVDAGVVYTAKRHELRVEDGGWLIEGPSENQAIESLGVSTWTQQGVTPSYGATTSPFDGVSADIITEDTSTGVHRVTRSYAGVGAVYYAISCEAKVTSGSRYLNLALYDSAGASTFVTVTFDLINGAVFGTPTGYAYGIESTSDGYYYAWASGLAPNGTGNISSNYQMHNGSSASYTGDGSSAMAIIGMQSENDRKYPSSHIITTTAAQARAGDKVNLPVKGNHPASNQPVSYIVEFDHLGAASTNKRLFEVKCTAGNIYAYINTSGSLVFRYGTADSSAVALSANTRYQASFTFDGTNQIITLNGVDEVSGAASGTVTIDHTDKIYIGRSASDTLYLDGRIYEFQIAKGALDATERVLL